MQESDIGYSGGMAAPLVAGRWAAFKPWLAWLGGGLLLGWALAIVWWAVLSPDARPATDDELIIPPGTAAAISSGQGAFVPAAVSLVPGGRLIVYNRDDVEHAVGNVVIPPGAVAEISAPEEGGGFACTIHPSGFLGVRLTERPSFLTTIVPALFVGLPIGILAGAAAWVGTRLRFDDE